MRARRLVRDEPEDTTTFHFEQGSRTLVIPPRFTAEDGQVMIATVRDREPGHASLRVESLQTIRTPNGCDVEIRGEGKLCSNDAQFLCELDVRLLENGRLVREKH